MLTFEKSLNLGRPNTVRTYKGLFNNHIKLMFTEDMIRDWKDEYLTIAVNTWLDEELAPRTVESLIRVLSKYIEFIKKIKIDTTQIIRKVQRLQQQPRVNALSYDEAKQLTKICQENDNDYYPIFLLGLHAGLRRGEVFGLESNDIDLLQNQLLIQRSYNGPTKSGKSRVIPLSDELYKVLLKRNYIVVGRNEKLFKTIDPNPRLHKLCQLSGIRQITFHDLRHTFATLALEHPQISPKDVQLWLGHESLKTTLDIYWSSVKNKGNINVFLPKGD